MDDSYAIKESNVGSDLDRDVESNPRHGGQELGWAPRRQPHQDSSIFSPWHGLSIALLFRRPTHRFFYKAPVIRPLLLRPAFFLLPSFLQTRIRGRTDFDSTAPGHQKKGGGNSQIEKPRALSPTAYLDGMRGIAAFSVFLCHYFYTCFVIAEGWGSGGSNYYFLKLPFIRLFYSGPPMVCIFFVISGYALSLKPLKLIHSASSTSPSSTPARTHGHAYSKLLETLSSLVFRRGLRLFLPPAISTFIIVILLRLGVYEWNRTFASDPEFLRNVQEIHYTRFDSATEQFVDWAYAVLNFVHLWDWDAFAGSTGIDVHLWTIPVEFRASMVLFLTILGTARLRMRVRIGVILGWCVFAFLWERWEMCLFWMGTVLAEGDVAKENAAKAEIELVNRRGGGQEGILPVVQPVVLARTGDVLPRQQLHHQRRHPQSHYNAAAEGTSSDQITSDTRSEGQPRPRSSSAITALSSSVVRTTFFPTFLLLISLYLLSQPDINSHLAPGWIVLTSLIPYWWTEHYRFYQPIGAVIFVYAVSKYPSSACGPSSASARYAAPVFSRYLNPKTMFESSMAQYLGKISYAIYLVHGPVLHTLGYTVMKLTWTHVTGTETDRQYITGFVLASFLVVPLVVWVADVFWRGVDEPVVKFARKVEERVVVVG
ncbi:acyltransferase family-domain-containing protein [Sordaria brevicollis]|uniref:Acyltransferase family-domain-containing protein n=1 Tax=Sordaria brevicollis TaxID=83679 RepID=A0AAE0PNW2_SORBR|nr:acyltransferase family-domain-containing protein [Sordaria brevicollis]